LILLAPRLRAVLATDRLWLQLLRSALLFGATLFFFRPRPPADRRGDRDLRDRAALHHHPVGAGARRQVGPRRWMGVVAGLAGRW
jgi:hypothetical protein